MRTTIFMKVAFGFLWCILVWKWIRWKVSMLRGEGFGMDRGPDEAEARVAGPREAAEERKASEARDLPRAFCAGLLGLRCAGGSTRVGR